MHATLGRIVNDVKGLVKHFEMIQTQLEQLTKVQNDLFAEMSGQIKEQACSVKTRGGAFTQDPLYPEGHPKRLEQDSQMLDENVVSSPKNKKKKKHKRIREASKNIDDTSEELEKDPNSVSISDAETESGNEHDNDIDKNDAPNKEENEVEPANPPKNKKYDKEILLLGSMVKKENLGCKNLCLFLVSLLRVKKKNIIINFVSG